MVDNINQAVILAGGIGARLRPLTYEVPKPMVLVNNRPFLEYLIDMLRENGISEVVLLLGYLAEKVTQHFGDGSRFGVNIKYSIGKVSDKTGTRIRNAKFLLNDFFLLMYCDNYWPLNLKRLFESYTKQQILALATVYTNKDAITRNNILVGGDGKVMKYDKTREDNNLNGVEIGFFIMNKKILEIMPNRNFSFEEETLPQLITGNQLHGYQTDHRYYSISTPERLELMEKFLQPKKVIFLDRDGVINKNPPKADYVKTWEEFEFLEGAIQALKLLNQNGYDIYIVTNQAGIARGVMREQDLINIHENLRKEVEKHNARITAIYYCPHGWDDGCECRKPNPGMLFRAAREHHLDLTKSIFIGDDERDLEAGNAVGCKTFIITPGENLLKIVQSVLQSAREGRNVHYDTLLDSLLKSYFNSDRERFFCLIGGCAQSGKTTLAKRIENDLRRRNIKCIIISLDNWLLGIEERRGNETVRERFKYQEIVEAVSRVKKGDEIYAPVYDPRTRSIIDKKSQRLYIAEGIVIVDGVVALDIEELRNTSECKIFVDIDESVRKERLRRFYMDYKKCSSEEAEEVIQSRECEEVPIIKKTRDYADMVYKAGRAGFN